MAAVPFVRDVITLLASVPGFIATVSIGMPTFSVGDLLFCIPKSGRADPFDGVRLNSISAAEGWLPPTTFGITEFAPDLTPFFKVADGSETSLSMDIIGDTTHVARLVVLSIGNYDTVTQWVHEDRDATYYPTATPRTKKIFLYNNQSLLLTAFSYAETNAAVAVSFGTPDVGVESEPHDPVWSTIRNPSEVAPISMFSADGPEGVGIGGLQIGRYYSERTGGGFSQGPGAIERMDEGAIYVIHGPSDIVATIATGLPVRKRQLSAELFSIRRGPQAVL